MRTHAIPDLPKCTTTAVLVSLEFLILTLSGDVELNPGPILRDSAQDLACLVNKLRNVRKDWYFIGLHLGVEDGILKNFETEVHSNRRRLTEVLSYWLKQNTHVAVSWKSIVNAMRCIDQNSLANKLEKEFIKSVDIKATESKTKQSEQDEDQTEPCEVDMDQNGQEEPVEAGAIVTEEQQQPVSDTESIDLSIAPPRPKIMKLSNSRTNRKSSRKRQKIIKRYYQKKKHSTRATTYDVSNGSRIKSANQSQRNALVSEFRQHWEGHECPNDDQIEHVFIVENQHLFEKWSSYRQTLMSQAVEVHYHGTSITCDIANTQRLCSDQNCGICGISLQGFDKRFIRQSKRFQRFGAGFYVAPNSSKCHAYTVGSCHGHRAMLVCDICPGNKYTTDKDNEILKAPPQGYDSVHGSGGILNHDELVLYNPDAILPKAIVVYKMDGVKEIPNTCSAIINNTQRYNVIRSQGWLLLYGTLTSLMFVYCLATMFI